MANNNNRPSNSLGASQDSASVGWLGPVLTKMANERRYVVPQLDDNQIIVKQGYPLQLMSTTPSDLLDAVRINALGSAAKAIVTANMTTSADSTLDLGSVRSFGVRVKISDSPLNFRFGYYNVQLRDGATVLADVYVSATKVPVDIVLLGIANNGGQATPLTIANPQVVVVGSANGSAVTTTTFVAAETLNQRDLGEIANR